MKHVNKATYFLSGMLVMLLLISMITPALAAGLSKYIEVSTGVSVYVDDVKLDPRDANGNPVDVFIYNGTTYLPVRAISNSLGVPIQWDGSTWSVYVGKHTGDKPTAWLADMDYFSGTSSVKTSESLNDNTGSTHYHCMTGNFNRIYLLNGQYSNLTGTIFQKHDYRSYTMASNKPGLRIYGDGELIYDGTFKSGDTGIEPVDFNINLTGVLKLEIVFDGGNYWGDYLALGDVGLWT